MSLCYIGTEKKCTSYGGRCHNLKNGKETSEVKIQGMVKKDALGKVNRIKEISRREQDGLMICTHCPDRTPPVPLRPHRAPTACKPRKPSAWSRRS